jgi:tetratricopeptide (TPR) repeat protein
MTAKTVFISYRRDSTGRAFARSLKQELTHHGYDVFFDVDSIDAGKWAEQIRKQVPERSHFLLLLTPGALDRCEDQNDWVRREFELAVASKRNIVPVREESVDLAKLRESCPESMKGLFIYQIATVQSAGFERDVETLIRRYIAPHMAPALSQQRPSEFHADISRIIKYAPEELIGRETETKLLSDAWDQIVRGEKRRAHILTFVALGGEGKTSLVAKWTAELAHQDWPGCDAVFTWSFYSQGTREQTAVSSDAFLAEALTFFGDPKMAGSPAGAFEKGRRLAQLVGEQRALLILDGLEPLQYAPSSPTPGELKDQGVAALLKGLAATNHGLCVLTTRYAIPELKAFAQTTAPLHDLVRLSKTAGVALLKTLGVKTGSRDDFERLVEDVDGHALTLQIIGAFLARAFHGDIRRRDHINFEKADAKIQGGHAFRAMEAYVHWLEDDSEEARREVALLKLLGLFDRPATADCVDALRQAPAVSDLTEPLVGLAEDDWEFSITSLRDAKLLTVNRDKGSGELIALDAHPLLREYFAQRLRQQQPDAWRAAHRRLYEHLCGTTKEGDEPTLEDLQPLYQAVAHGCHAGLHQRAFDEVYFSRIARQHEFYSTKKLGAYGADLGAVACFFNEPFKEIDRRLGEPWIQAGLLNQAATRLRSLGRLTEAIEPMRISAEMNVKAEAWGGAAIAYSNLSELELTLGEVAGAVRDAEQAVTYADRRDDAFQRMTKRVRMADALHHAGQRTESRTRFRQAEEMLGQDGQLLSGMAGFQYCNLLLTEAERIAWQMTLQLETRNSDLETAAVSCRAISKRAAQALKIAERSNWLRDIALDHLTLGRAALYEAILEGSFLDSCKLSLQRAVNGFRHAGTQDYLPSGLVTRACLRSLERDQEGARVDLDDAWEISERGPMRLFMADIHLYRARLFHSVKPYPWTSPQEDLAAARKLIEQCGYWRRKEELEDAEEAAKNW